MTHNHDDKIKVIKPVSFGDLMNYFFFVLFCSTAFFSSAAFCCAARMLLTASVAQEKDVREKPAGYGGRNLRPGCCKS